ncbi:MAG: sugar phosphate isomerase/epimerase [Armatimonadetes bacterium]|nr:sugar phosphate isomerase/epimerase [Armatimonadota bacterium]
MIKSISYWSFPGGLEGAKSVSEALMEAKKAGFEALEVCLSETGDVSLETTEASAKKIVQMACDEGIRLSSVACGLFWDNSLSSGDPKLRSRAMDIARKLIDVASWLELDAVLVVAGSVDVFFNPACEVVDFEAAYGRATEAIEKLESHARAARVVIGVENVWNKFLIGPAEMKGFIDQFNSEWVASYFDVGNCMLVGYPEHWIRSLGKRIKRVHFKDFRRSVGTVDGFVDLLSGDVNWPEVVKALQEVGYDSFVTAEMIPLYKHYPEALIDNTSRAMDSILGRK